MLSKKSTKTSPIRGTRGESRRAEQPVTQNSERSRKGASERRPSPTPAVRAEAVDPEAKEPSEDSGLSEQQSAVPRAGARAQLAAAGDAEDEEDEDGDEDPSEEEFQGILDKSLDDLLQEFTTVVPNASPV